jgi:hypothetical protein
MALFRSWPAWPLRRVAKLTGISVAQRTNEVVAVLASSALDRGRPNAGTGVPRGACAMVRAPVFRQSRCRCPETLDKASGSGAKFAGFLPSAAAEIRIHKETVSAYLGD